MLLLMVNLVGNELGPPYYTAPSLGSVGRDRSQGWTLE